LTAADLINRKPTNSKSIHSGNTISGLDHSSYELGVEKKSEDAFHGFICQEK